MLGLRAFSFPAVVITLAFSVPHPRDIFSVYSTQGAFAWLLIHFCRPWVAYVAFMYVVRKRDEGTKKNLFIALGLVSFYALATILVSMYASQNLSSTWGSSLSPSVFWRALNFPLSLLVFYIG